MMGCASQTRDAYGEPRLPVLCLIHDLTSSCPMAGQAMHTAHGAVCMPPPQLHTATDAVCGIAVRIINYDMCSTYKCLPLESSTMRNLKQMYQRPQLSIHLHATLFRLRDVRHARLLRSKRAWDNNGDGACCMPSVV